MKQQRAPTVLELWFWLVTRIIGWLFMGCLGCIVVCMVMINLHGQAGIYTLNQLEQNDYHTVISNMTNNHTVWVSQWIQAIPESITQPNIHLPVINSDYQHKLWLQLLPFIHATLGGAKLLLIRLYLLLRWSILFVILGVVGLIDGLGRRYIRRMAAGRESAFIYHHAKPLIMLSLILGIFMVLMLPVSIIHTEWIVMTSAMTFGLAIQITTKSFKKYL
ncbi:MAG: DUF4400 domain-containing protein [Legionellales bacterium]|nr:DUF4400 domain-containing protein [Legionellales bacterium]